MGRQANRSAVVDRNGHKEFSETESQLRVHFLGEYGWCALANCAAGCFRFQIGDKQIVPQWWIEMATKSSQKLNPSYGYTFWVNTDGVLWPTAPRDAFAFRSETSKSFRSGGSKWPQRVLRN